MRINWEPTVLRSMYEGHLTHGNTVVLDTSLALGMCVAYGELAVDCLTTTVHWMVSLHCSSMDMLLCIGE